MRIGEHRVLVVFASAMLAAGIGCTTLPERFPSATPVLEQVNSRADQQAQSNNPAIESVIERSQRRPIKNVLVLSSGGMNGAYPAGVLKGWSQTGTRPEFDVVTGVSTGALLGTLAFLGPDYDDAMERAYTKARPWDVFIPKPPVPWSDSLAASRPLRNRIDKEITPAALERIAIEHKRGRRLYVGTTHLETKQLVIWDMGAIATEGEEGLELFRTILLASCSIPGLLPPVSIEMLGDSGTEKELHVDGSVAASLFLRQSLLGFGDSRSCPANIDGANVYVLVAGKLKAESAAVPRNLIHLSGESLHGVLQSRQEGDLLRTYLLCWHCGANFHLTGIPQTVDFGSAINSVSLGPKELRQLFDLGVQSASDASTWESLPPGVLCDEHAVPRDGKRVVRKSPPFHSLKSTVPKP